MREYKYKVSVIVPVYNVEGTIRECLGSLLRQTISRGQMEVVMINDGSTDKSFEICKSYAKKYPSFKAYSKENGGVSSARNFGLKQAQGKYLMFLDSDDMYSSEVVKSATDFFDTVYDEVDLVTFLDQRYNNGVQMPLHYRYDYMNETGVYDLEEYHYIAQTRLNICVKNRFEKNILFDENIGYHEDQMYCNEILAEKLKIGYTEVGEYMYINRSGSITNTNANAVYLFDKTMDYWARLFDSYKTVPKYFQALYLSDISWKLKSMILIPYNDYESAMKRISRLLDRVDDKMILEHPATDTFHRHFFLGLKSDAERNTVAVSEGAVRVLKNGRLILKEESFEIIFNKLLIKDGRLIMLAYLKSCFFNYAEKPELYAAVELNDGKRERIKLDLFLSSWSWYKTKEQTNNFYGFYFEYDISRMKAFRIIAETDGRAFDTHYYMLNTAPFSTTLERNKAIFPGYLIEHIDGYFTVRKLNKEQYLSERRAAAKNNCNTVGMRSIRKGSDKLIGKEIWLYYDCRGVDVDNGYYQFIHDLEKNDGVERYFINANDTVDPKLFSAKQRKRVVRFGSKRHKILYVSASKILTGYIEGNNIEPFNGESEYFTDIINTEIIYLQHGILHAHLPWKYSPGRVNCDKIVVSSGFELENFTNIYKFRAKDLIPAGMPRFEHIDRSGKPVNRILFAPSWRNYLIGGQVKNVWELTDEKFVKSDYFRVFNEFLNDKRLNEVLEKHDLWLYFKIHPIFRPYLRHFDKKNSRVTFADNSVDDEKYALFITDFSSFVFNFAYLGRPIIYFLPDELEFVAGMNQYRELDLPFDKAFGNMYTEAGGVIDDIERIAENGFQPEPVYKERIDNFFLPIENCCEKIYEAVKNGK